MHTEKTFWTSLKNGLSGFWFHFFIPLLRGINTVLATIALPLTAIIVSGTAIIVAALVTTTVGQGLLAAGTIWVVSNFFGFDPKDLLSKEGGLTLLELIF